MRWEPFAIIGLILFAFVIENVDEIDCFVRGRIWLVRRRIEKRSKKERRSGPGWGVTE